MPPPGLVFGVQLDHSCRLKSMSSDGVNRVVDKLSPEELGWRPTTKPNGPLHSFPRLVDHFVSGMSNRVENQKLNEMKAGLPNGSVFRVQLSLRQPRALIKTKEIRRRKTTGCHHTWWQPVVFLFLILLVLIVTYGCRRPSWRSKRQPGGSKLETPLPISVKKCSI